MPRVVQLLERLKQRDVTQDYTYYGLASPWLQVKALRVLQYFPAPEEPGVRRMLVDIVKRILGGALGCSLGRLCTHVCRCMSGLERQRICSR